VFVDGEERRNLGQDEDGEQCASNAFDTVTEHAKVVFVRDRNERISAPLRRQGGNCSPASGHTTGSMNYEGSVTRKGEKEDEKEEQRTQMGLIGSEPQMGLIGWEQPAPRACLQPGSSSSSRHPPTTATEVRSQRRTDLLDDRASGQGRADG
jgi:hypothetical protein